jgi:5-methyltetrahydropteroyltriglutamate--homocysteine methyltransferase
MRHSNGRTLTTHTGSLPRSDTLVNLLAAQNRGEPVDAETFAAEVESSTRQVIKNQAQSGIDVGNNGEQSRMSFSTYVTLRMSGLAVAGSGEATETRMSFLARFAPGP